MDDIFIGKNFGEYCSFARLEKHSRNRVYLAISTQPPSRTAVIKIYMNRRLRVQPENEREDFIREVRVLSTLKHPHLLPVIDVGVMEGWPYVIMEYAPGGSLRHRLEQQLPALLPTEKIQKLIEQMSLALDYLHQRKRVHGNIKLENILFRKAEQAFLSDVDIQPFMQLAVADDPEHTSSLLPSERKSTKHDQQMLGCVAYELFTGHPPFPDAEPSSEQKMITPPSQFNAKLSPQVEAVLLKALAKEPADRYEGVLQFSMALREALESTIEPMLEPLVAVSGVRASIDEEPPSPTTMFPKSVVAATPLPEYRLVPDYLLPDYQSISDQQPALGKQESELLEKEQSGGIGIVSAPPTVVTKKPANKKGAVGGRSAVKVWLIFSLIGILLGAGMGGAAHFLMPAKKTSAYQAPATAIVRRSGQHLTTTPQPRSSSPGATVTSTPAATAMASATPTTAAGATPAATATPGVATPTATGASMATLAGTIADPGFESPSVNGGSAYNPANTAWTYNSQQPGSSGAGIAANGSAFLANSAPAPQGEQVGFIQGTSSISQMISLNAGTYLFTFQAAQRSTNRSGETMQVWLDGTLLNALTPGTSYGHYTMGPLSVNTGMRQLTFKGAGNSGGTNTVLIDNVAVQQR